MIAVTCVLLSLLNLLLIVLGELERVRVNICRVELQVTLLSLTFFLFIKVVWSETVAQTV